MITINYYDNNTNTQQHNYYDVEEVSLNATLYIQRERA